MLKRIGIVETENFQILWESERGLDPKILENKDFH